MCRVNETRKAPVVIKVGTSTLMSVPEPGALPELSLSRIAELVELIATLQRKGERVVLVSSGSVGVGAHMLGLESRPTRMSLKRACAATGMPALMQVYTQLFSSRSLRIAQVLVCRADFVNLTHYKHLIATVEELLDLGVVPILNENDTVSNEELRFGDNDSLAAMTACALKASSLFLLTDVDCLYSADPNTDPNASPIRYVGVSSLAKLIAEAESSGSNAAQSSSGWGCGGMTTKLTAARLAAAAGIWSVLVHGEHPLRVAGYMDVLESRTAPGAEPLAGAAGGPPTEAASPREAAPSWVVGASVPEGTVFEPVAVRQDLHDARTWLLSLPVEGSVVLKPEAMADMLLRQKAVTVDGIVEVRGRFDSQAAVRILGPAADGEGEVEVARALWAMSSGETVKAVSKASLGFKTSGLLGQDAKPEEAAARQHIMFLQ